MISACGSNSLGLKSVGSIVVWGSNGSGQCYVPLPNEGFVTAAMGWGYCLGVRAATIPPAVYMAQFQVVRRGAQATIHWVISLPRAHAGFHVWREEPGSNRVQINQALLSGQEAYDFIDPTPPTGSADYWLQEVTTDGSDSWYGPAHLDAVPIPTALRLGQNQPNPFNPRTTFSFSLPKSGRVVLAIYDVRGAQIATLIDADMLAGEQTAEWGGLDSRGLAVPSGVYFARLETPTGLRTVKVTLAR